MSLSYSKSGSAHTDLFYAPECLYPEEGRSAEVEVNAMKMNKIHYYFIYNVKFTREHAKEFGYS